MKRNTIISLFDYSGSWSKPYKDAGFNVIQIDLKLGVDILKWNYKKININSVFGILAAPPCTIYTKVSQHLWLKYNESGKTENSNNLVYKCLEIIQYFNPQFWALENPPGRITKCIPELKNYRLLSFKAFVYGDPISKHFIIYGNFNPFLVRNQVKQQYRFKNIAKSWCDDLVNYYKDKYPGFTRQEIRSITPPGFAQAFFNANNK